MLIPWEDLNSCHPAMEMCAKGAEQNCQQQVVDEAHERAAEAFHSYGRPLTVVLLFKYLRRVLTTSDDDWLAFI